MKSLKFILAILLATLTSTVRMGSPIPAGAELISDKITVDIARKTFLLASPPQTFSPEELDERSVQVKNWMISMGGNNWYKGYLERYGYPTSPEEMKVSSLIGLKSQTLGKYYIHSPLISTASVTAKGCGPDFATSITEKALCALANRDSAIAFNDSAALTKFRELAAWFLANQNDGKWEWSMDVPSRNQKAPWISGLSQAMGISVLLREYQLSNDPAYLEAARKALGWIQMPLKEGGLAVKMKKGTWYEEYPDAANPSHILNGHMWALFGIWDFYRVTGDENAKKMFDQGVVALTAELDKYDVGYWSVYAQTNRLDMVTGAYQQFIIEQLRVIHAITNIKKFEDTANRWAASMTNDSMFIHNAANEFIKANPEIVGKKIAYKN
ncbi:D-glucuronyl C5-epimerase family protein [Pseudomonas sp. BN102]|uniref:D-glucuronyl C5-epimerase family protein n=1 Tax=Pseudomonas sp. BN102 TaxID=2567886 RepID=UPI002456DC00|nr:D-glucuronyl C5-epimerase family protein [Pseudomonas sp. BN102]